MRAARCRSCPPAKTGRSGAWRSPPRRWSLPAGHPDRRSPREAYIRALYVITGGAVEPSNLVVLPVLDASLKRKAAELLEQARGQAKAAQHRGRAKGAKMSARSRARLARSRAAAANASRAGA